LGFVGGSFFLGMFYLPIRALASSKLQGSRAHTEVERFAPFMFGILAATVVGMMSSTRTYSIPTYLIVGMCASYMREPSDQEKPALSRFDSKLVGELARASLITLVTLYIYVRITLR